MGGDDACCCCPHGASQYQSQESHRKGPQMMIRERRKKENTVIEREKRGLRRFVTYSVGVCGADPHGQRVVRNDKTYFYNVFMA